MRPEKVLKVSEDIIGTKKFLKNSLKTYCETGIFMLKFHMLYHVVEM